MNCENVATLLDEQANGTLDPACWVEVADHLAHCEDCEDAWYALQKLRVRRAAPTPPPRPELFAETMALAANQPTHSTNRFWLGTTVGGVVAAAFAWAFIVFGPVSSPQTDSQNTAALTVALHETRSVDVAINSPEAVKDAHIRVLLTGAVSLVGFESQSEIHWLTDLDAGINMLSLPVTMEAVEGGQLFVEIEYADHQKTFVINLNSEHIDMGRDGPRTSDIVSSEEAAA